MTLFKGSWLGISSSLGFGDGNGNDEHGNPIPNRPVYPNWNGFIFSKN